jgi:hypothetical protein
MYHGHEHLMFALLIFFSVLLGLQVLKHIPWPFYMPDMFCAAACVIFFYSGREFRDAEKLGYWDAPGFWWPVGGALVLYAAAFLLSKLLGNAKSYHKIEPVDWGELVEKVTNHTDSTRFLSSPDRL